MDKNTADKLREHLTHSMFDGQEGAIVARCTTFLLNDIVQAVSEFFNNEQQKGNNGSK